MEFRPASLAVLGAAIACVWPRAAQATHDPQTLTTAELGYSDCRYTPSPNGQFWQSDSDHSSRYKSGCGRFGLGLQITPAWNLNAAWVNLGRTDVNALAWACPGDDCTRLVKSVSPDCPQALKENCQYRFNSGAYARGLALGTRLRLFEAGPIKVEVLGGLYAHKLTSHAQVEPINCHDGPNCQRFSTLDQTAFRISPIWGASAQWKFLFVSWEAYENIGVHTPVTANVKGRVEVKTLGLRIPF